jgi:hypothetical protein
MAAVNSGLGSIPAPQINRKAKKEGSHAIPATGHGVL